MKRRLFLGSILSATVVFFIACGGNGKKGTSFDAGFEGLYAGQLPCADCPGIDTKLTFFSDSTVAITAVYLEGDGTSFTEKGTWSIANGLLKTSIDNYNYYYKRLSDTEIVMTDSLGEESANLGDFYKLSKQNPLTSSAFEGEFALGDTTLANGYVQNLYIKALGDNRVAVTISSEGAGKGCEFDAEGRIINDQIEIALNTKHTAMNSTMTIRFVEDGKLSVFSSEFDDRYDLMYFCGGGGSLAGEYSRK